MYVDLAGLARYKSDFGAWARGALLPKDAAAARVRTAKAGAVSFVPVQETPLDVSVDFLFAETPPAEGDKGPENPSTITGVSSVIVSQIGGKNLLAYNFPTATVPNNTTKTVGQTVATNTNGIYSLSGTVTSAVNNIYITHNTEEQNELKIPAGTYTLSGFSVPASVTAFTRLTLQLVDIDDGTVTPIYCNGSTTFTTDNTKKCNVYIRGAQNTVYPQGFTCAPQLEQGSEATAFEPSYVTNYTIDLGSTYYGGTLDAATGVMTVTHWGIALDGQNDGFTLHSSSTAEYSYFQWANIDYGLLVGVTSAVCSHFIYDYNLTNTNTFAFYSTSGTIRLKTDATDFPDATAFKIWLATQYNNGTPVVFCMALAANKRYTVQLSPTEILSLTQSSDYDPRVNTVYSDQQAVQVGYLKHPSAASADLRSALVSLGGGV